jgi:pre-mRNA-splicing factor CWC22
MDKPTDDSIEVAITLLKECGEMLTRVIPKGLHCKFFKTYLFRLLNQTFLAVFERLRSILEDADTIDTRTQQMIEMAMAVRKNKFKDYPSVLEELDLIDEEDQISHIVELSPEDGKPLDPETQLNYYKYDPDFEHNEQAYEEIRQKIIGDAEGSDDEADNEEEDGGMEAAPQGKNFSNFIYTQKLHINLETPQTQKIIDMTEQDMVAFRRNVYLAIQSSLDFQEAAHKLIKFHLKPGLDVRFI